MHPWPWLPCLGVSCPSFDLEVLETYLHLDCALKLAARLQACSVNIDIEHIAMNDKSAYDLEKGSSPTGSGAAPEEVDYGGTIDTAAFGGPVLVKDPNSIWGKLDRYNKKLEKTMGIEIVRFLSHRLEHSGDECLVIGHGVREWPLNCACRGVSRGCRRMRGRIIGW